MCQRYRDERESYRAKLYGYRKWLAGLLQIDTGDETWWNVSDEDKDRIIEYYIKKKGNDGKEKSNRQGII